MSSLLRKTYEMHKPGSDYVVLVSGWRWPFSNHYQVIVIDTTNDRTIVFNGRHIPDEDAVKALFNNKSANGFVTTLRRLEIPFTTVGGDG